MARLALVSYDLPEDRSEQEQAFARLRELAREQQELARGALIELPGSHGVSYYLLTQVNPLTLQYVPYADSRPAPAHVVRKLRRADVESARVR